MSGLDPRGRLVVTAAMALTAFLVGPAGGACLAFAGLMFLAPSLRRARHPRRVLVVLFLFFVLGAGVNILFMRGEDLIWRVPIVGIRVTRESLMGGLSLGLRAVNLGIAAAILTVTTSGAAIAHAGASILSPLERVVGGRVHVFLFQMQLAIRFVPLLFREAERIITSQRMRGHRLDGSLPARARALGPLFVPVLAVSLLKAHRLSLALSARGYEPGMPLPLRFQQSWRWYDTAFVAIALGLLVALWGGVG